MALGRTSKYADDFVHDISDNDSVPDLDAATEEEVAIGSTKKRKLNGKQFQSANGHGKNKKRKLAPAAEGDEAANEEYENKDEDAGIDSDFEFEVDGGATLLSATDDWFHVEGLENKSGHILDDIISRRRKEKADMEASGSEREEGSDEDEEDSDDIEDEEGSPSAFADEDEDEDTENNHDGEEEQFQTNGRIDGSEEEDDVAEPVPHPDDAIESDDDQEDEDEIQTERQRAFFAPEEAQDNSKSTNWKQSSFSHMSLSRPILKGLNAVGFSAPTPIQIKAVPVALLGKDLVGGAVTGSGKTAAFIIPILERLLYRQKAVPTTRVAVLMPTRELAVQCHNVATKLATFTDITFTLLVGGLSLREQEQALKKRPDVVIATPGRFIDHMRNSASFAVENIEILILDEADRMLEDGFADELNEILTTIPKSRQTMLFSATMTQDVDKLIRVGLKQPVRLMVDAKRQTVSGLVQEFIKFKPGQDDAEERRLAYLLHLCTHVYTSRTIVFLPRKTLAHRANVLLLLHGIKAAELHGSMSQEQRLAAIAGFRDGTKTHLLATDLASRGLDIPHTDAVINLTVPNSTDTYLHRVGRTARAGRSGVSCTIFESIKTGSKSKSSSSGGTSERTLLKPILRLARTQKAAVRSRSVPSADIDRLVQKIQTLQPEIDAILIEEKEQRVLQQSERDLKKGENLVKYEKDIASRPKRTWFQSEKDKKAASALGRAEVNGISDTNGIKKEKKRKLSGKDRKRLEMRDERREGKLSRKKGRAEREGQGVLTKGRSKKPKGKGAVNAKPKGRR